MEKDCSKCGKELTVQENIYYDIPAGSRKGFCQKCYDDYMIAMAETGMKLE